LSLIEPNLDLGTRVQTDRPDFTFEKIVITQTVLGERVWELESEYAEIDTDTKQTKLRIVRGRFYKDDQVIVTVEAPSALLNMEMSDMVLDHAFAKMMIQDEVVSLNATVLTWKSNAQQFEGSGLVKINTGAVQLSGDYFKVDIPGQKLILSENSKAIIVPPNGDD